MNTLIIYDSAYGNTEQVAKSLALATKHPDTMHVMDIDSFELPLLETADLIVVGSPTQGGRPTPKIQEFLNNLPDDVLTGKQVAAFDTRFAISEHGLGLKIVMKTVGFAAARIAKSLASKGGSLVSQPEGFIVEDKDGPLQSGELERASAWMRDILISRNGNEND